ncbi:hypothetical protein D3C73_1457290 [compost metagenome]
MLCADVSVAQLAGFVHRQLDHFLGARRVRDVRRLFLSSADQRLHFVLNFFEAEAKADQCFGGDAVAFADQSQQNMFCADIIVSQPDGFFLCQRKHFLCAFRKSAKHHNPAPP